MTSTARPLEGVSVVVTRPRPSGDELASVLAGAGARVLSVPAIELRGPDDAGTALRAALEDLGRYAWVVFTSANAVHRTVPFVGDARAFAAVRLAAVGRATEAALASHHLVADLVPSRANADALVEAFPSPEPEPEPEPEPTASADVRARVGSEPERRVLFPCAAGARPTLPAGLRAKGWEVDEVVAYRTVAAPPPPAAMLGPLSNARAIVFSSPSAVRAYLEMRVGDGRVALPVPPAVVCGGPTTAAAARGAHLEVAAEARAPSPEALLRALVEVLGGGDGSARGPEPRTP